jgi:phospholipase/carboxylesterase/glyoxalase family protein
VGTSPTLLLLHGTGGDETDLIPLGDELASGVNLLSPRGKVLEHGMPRFFRRLAEGVFDEEDLKLRTGELADFIEEASGRYGFDPGNIFAVGFSNGANIAGSLLLSNPGLLRGAVLFRPMVPLGDTERLAELLREAGAEVELRWQPGGHGLEYEEVDAAKGWLGRVLEGRKGAA